MNDFDEWEARLVQVLMGAVRRGELTRDFLQGFLLHHVLERAHRDPGGALPRPTDPRDTEPEEALARTVSNLVDLDPDELAEEARRELVELLGTPKGERQRLLDREDHRFASPLLADELITEAREAVLRDPGEALELAGLAVTVAHRIDPLTPGTDRQLETLARACAYQANARRVCGELEPAEIELDLARRCLERVGHPHPLTAAELDGLLASLRADQRRFAGFHRLLDGVIARYREHGRLDRAAHSLLLKGLYLYHEERYEEAIDVVAEGRALITPEENAWLCLCAEHQMALILCDMGFAAEAGRRLEANRGLYERFGRRTRLRRQWLRAKIAHGLGEAGEAERLYREAREGFLGQRSPFDAALVGLDLARLFLEEGRSREVRELAEAMLPVFREQEVHEETAAALRLFRSPGGLDT